MKHKFFAKELNHSGDFSQVDIHNQVPTDGDGAKDFVATWNSLSFFFVLGGVDTL